MNPIKLLLRKFLLGYRASAKTYIAYLRKGGARIGENVIIYSPNLTDIDVQFPWMLTIGNNVRVTQGVHILNHDYSWSVLKKSASYVTGGVGRVSIGDNVFIGINSIILMHTTIGSNVIVGAGSVVKGNIPDNSVVAGNPAKVICSLDRYMEKRLAAQYDEAADIVKQYRHAFGTNPPKEKLPAYFFLFENRDSMDNPVFLSRMNLDGGFDECMSVFRSTKPMYNSYEEFLESIN